MKPLKTWTTTDITPGTRVFLRLDANVSLIKGVPHDGGVFGRISQSLPEIDRLRKRGATLVLASHLGDPGGKLNKQLSLAPVAKLFEKRLKRSIPLVQLSHKQSLKAGGLYMLENLRFHPGEEADDKQFAKTLAGWAQVYVNNAFGVCHRKHASVHAITKYLPSFAGELLQREVEELSRPLEQPFTLIMGGAKIATKIALLKRLGAQAESILLGGGLAVTFLAAEKATLPTYPQALLQPAEVALARRLLRQFRHKLRLPVDVVADPKQELIYDIGPETMKMFAKEVAGSGSVLWNGPLGIVESPHGQAGTMILAKAIKKAHGRAVTGGGDTVDFLEAQRLLSGFSHVSTGGGAMLAFLSGEKLPALEVLRRV